MLKRQDGSGFHTTRDRANQLNAIACLLCSHRRDGRQLIRCHLCLCFTCHRVNRRSPSVRLCTGMCTQVANSRFHAGPFLFPRSLWPSRGSFVHTCRRVQLLNRFRALSLLSVRLVRPAHYSVTITNPTPGHSVSVQRLPIIDHIYIDICEYGHCSHTRLFPCAVAIFFCAEHGKLLNPCTAHSTPTTPTTVYTTCAPLRARSLPVESSRRCPKVVIWKPLKSRYLP